MSDDLEERIAKLEAAAKLFANTIVPQIEKRLTVLESFHHWAATQMFIEIGQRLSILEDVERARANQSPTDEPRLHPFSINRPTEYLDIERVAAEHCESIEAKPQLVTWQGAPIHETPVEHLLKPDFDNLPIRTPEGIVHPQKRASDAQDNPRS